MFCDPGNYDFVRTIKHVDQETLAVDLILVIKITKTSAEASMSNFLHCVPSIKIFGTIKKAISEASACIRSVLFIAMMGSVAQATEVSVSFYDVGYGTFGGSQLQNIGSPQSLLSLPGISAVEFVQDTGSGRFEAIQAGCDSQGNDVAVTVRLTADPTLINNVSSGYLSFLGCVNWLDQPNGRIEGFGFMLPLGQSFTIDYIASGTPDVTFTRTAETGGTNLFADLTVEQPHLTGPIL